MVSVDVKHHVYVLQEEGGELDSTFAGPSEIKRREVVLDLEVSPEGTI